LALIVLKASVLRLYQSRKVAELNSLTKRLPYLKMDHLIKRMGITVICNLSI